MDITYYETVLPMDESGDVRKIEKWIETARDGSEMICLQDVLCRGIIARGPTVKDAEYELSYQLRRI